MDIAENSAILYAIMSAAVDAILVSDRSGKILRVNNSTATMFGCLMDDLVGQNVRSLMPAAIAREHDGYLQHHLETGERRIIGIGRDVEGLRADGTVFPLHLSVGRADIDGQTVFVAILHDLSRRQAAQEAVARSQRMDAIGQMTGGIAHDFNNLLTVIMGNLELLELTKMPRKSRSFLTEALGAAEMGADLTSRLMVFARKSSLRTELVAVNDLISESLIMLRRTLGAHIKIEAVLESQLWPSRADATQLQTAILNLALNAQDAMPNGGNIFVETRNVSIDDDYIAQEIGVRPGDYVRVSVADTGEGMSAETRQRALEPFFTTKSVGKGTGLGLSMVYGFVKQSDGHLTIYSEIGRGTRICLYFPAEIGAEIGPRPESKANGGPGLFGIGKVILIVEDDPRVLQLSVARLQEFGFQCLIATNADAAWDVLQRRDDVTIVFTDLVMPGEKTGYDLAQRIAAEKPGLRVLLTSGFSENVLKPERFSEEFAILRKPYRQADLAKSLQSVLED